MKGTPKYLKLIAIVEEGYETVTGKVEYSGDPLEEKWSSENVLSIKLNDDFSLPEDLSELDLEIIREQFVDDVLELARKRSKQ